MFKKQNTQELIAQIHNSFNTAGDKILASALDVLNQVGQTTIEKAARLKRVGFTNANDVKKAESIQVSKELAELIQYYQVKYPNNKFITKEQVEEINKKYSLVCAPVDRYKGFVPETKLKMIELFQIKSEDLIGKLIKVLQAWRTAKEHSNRKLGAKRIHETLGMDLIPANHPDLRYNGQNLFSVYDIWVEEIEIHDNDKMLICAPEKDMDLNGLKKSGSIFTSFTKVTVPDPVVLQPCKGGYLIVAAWGDEASDEIVVNQNNN